MGMGCKIRTVWAWNLGTHRVVVTIYSFLHSDASVQEAQGDQGCFISMQKKKKEKCLSWASTSWRVHLVHFVITGYDASSLTSPIDRSIGAVAIRYERMIKCTVKKKMSTSLDMYDVARVMTRKLRASRVQSHVRTFKAPPRVQKTRQDILKWWYRPRR